MPVYRFVVDGDYGSVYAGSEEEAADEIYDLYGRYPNWIGDEDDEVYDIG